MENNELYHYGVPGMKWGRRRATYVTVRKANINAKRAASAARKESIAKDRGTLSGLGSGRKMILNANKAAGKARQESIARDRAYNKNLRAENKSAKQSKPKLISRYQSNKNAINAGKKAAEESLARDRKVLSGIGSARKAANNASRARYIATMESRLNDRKYNDKVRRDRQAQKVADKAAKKISKQKIKDLQKQYGKLEDSMTYGKNANAAKNARIEKRMESIEAQIRKEEKRFK